MGLRWRWDRISLLLFTVVAAIVATVLTANADDGAPKAAPAAHAKSTPAAKPAATNAATHAATTAATTTAAAAPAPANTSGAGVALAAYPSGGVRGVGGCPSGAGRAVQSAPGTGRTVALTFDDGPGKFTPEVLRVLAAKHVRATFFMIGQQAAANPELVRQVAAQGHLIGDHTWTHRAPSAAAGWSDAQLSTEVDRTNAAFGKILGSGTCWFRPPEGITKGTEAVTASRGLRVALWSVDTEDWKVERGTESDTSAALSRHIAVNAVAGASQEHPVILMHDGGGFRGATVAALPAIIDFYRASGYTFVRLDNR